MNGAWNRMGRALSYVQNTQRCFFLIPNKQTAYISFIINTLFILLLRAY